MSEEIPSISENLNTSIHENAEIVKSPSLPPSQSHRIKLPVKCSGEYCIFTECKDLFCWPYDATTTKHQNLWRKRINRPVQPSSFRIEGSQECGFLPIKSDQPLQENMFTCLSYNILAQSLGSSCTPWTLSFPHTIDDTQYDELMEWNRKVATPMYKANFHKNYHSGNKILMRQLWSTAINNSMDIPLELRGSVTFVEIDTVSYYDSDKKVTHVATTLRGCLRNSYPELVDSLYAKLMEVEKYFMWENRGPKIFNTIMQSFSGNSTLSPGIIVLQEFDVNKFPQANYLGAVTGPLSWSKAMEEKGYSGIFVRGPHDDDESGTSLFWRFDIFELALPSHDASTYKVPSFPSVATMFCGTKFHNCIKNLDFHEKWHKKNVLADGSIEYALVEMDLPDRRNIGLIKLRHKKTLKVVLVAFGHLMTDTRDCLVTNKYAGEVRASELEKIRAYVEAEIAESKMANIVPIDAVILAFDSNINLTSEPQNTEFNTLMGKIYDKDGDSIQINTGAVKIESDGNVDVEFHWNDGLVLNEAFSKLHRWGENVGLGPEQVYSSFNMKRCAWIDMMWYSKDSLKVVSYNLISKYPAHPIPDEDHGSDHLPVGAVFQFV